MAEHPSDTRAVGGSTPPVRTVTVAQSVQQRFVEPPFAGSTPVGHLMRIKNTYPQKNGLFPAALWVGDAVGACRSPKPVTRVRILPGLLGQSYKSNWYLSCLLNRQSSQIGFWVQVPGSAFALKHRAECLPQVDCIIKRNGIYYKKERKTRNKSLRPGSAGKEIRHDCIRRIQCLLQTPGEGTRPRRALLCDARMEDWRNLADTRSLCVSPDYPDTVRP